MLHEISQQVPASAQVVPSAILVKGDRVDGSITRALVKRQAPPPGAENVNPHMRHWWFMFEVTNTQGSVWVQVDLIRENYRIIWNALKVDSAEIAYDEKVVPPNLTWAAIQTATETICRDYRVYYNPQTPDSMKLRHSCQDFVILLARQVGIAL